MCFIYIAFNFETAILMSELYIFYFTINCNRVHFKIGIAEFEGDSSILASPFWNGAEVLTKKANYIALKHSSSVQVLSRTETTSSLGCNSEVLQWGWLKCWLWIWKELTPWKLLFLAVPTT